jgi:adenylate cyclase class 2
MSQGAQETEVKLAVTSVSAIRSTLAAAGFQVSSERVFESNTVYDTAVPSLRLAGTLLRLRQAGPIATLTYKGESLPGKFKSREEREVEVSDHAAMSEILIRLGYLPTFRYEKYRTEFRQAHSSGIAGIAMLDETPIGVYLELEGAAEWIDRTAALLGFRESDYITASYARLYQQWCAAQGSEPTHMVFPAHA